MVALTERLNEVVAQNPEKYGAGTIARVAHAIRLEENDQRRRYRFFATIDDFMLYHELHPQWRDKAPSQLVKMEGGSSFYSTLSQFIRIAIPDKKERAEKYNSLFKKLPHKTQHYNCETLEEWIAAYQSNPALRGKSITEFRAENNSEGVSFYNQFHRWVCENAETKKERLKMLQTVLPRKDGHIHDAFKDWKAEFDNHPGWAGRSPREMYLDRKSGASAFYEAFRTWAKEKTVTIEDEAERETARRKLVNRLLKIKRKGWLH